MDEQGWREAIRSNLIDWVSWVLGASGQSPALHHRLLLEQLVMDKDRVVGSAKEVKGLVKETIGKATGDAKLQADGKADKVEGKIQNAIGGAKDAVRDALRE